MNAATACEKGHMLVQLALATQAAIIVDKAPGVSELDGAAIHDMRVASRRLRMALKLYKPYLEQKTARKLGKLARSITRDLGTRRELDVMLLMMREHREETHGVWMRFMDHAINVIDARRDAQSDYCRDAARLAAGEGFRSAVKVTIDGTDANRLCVLELARAGMLGALAEARAARSAWKSSADPEALHLVRIALKHLRYACEFHASLYGDAMTAQIDRIKAAQEILGEWNECRLLQDMVLALGGAADYSLAQGAPLVAEAYGQHAKELADQFRPIGKALLGKAARKEFRFLVEAEVEPCCQYNADSN